MKRCTSELKLIQHIHILRQKKKQKKKLRQKLKTTVTHKIVSDEI